MTLAPSVGRASRQRQGNRSARRRGVWRSHYSQVVRGSRREGEKATVGSECRALSSRLNRRTGQQVTRPHLEALHPVRRRRVRDPGGRQESSSEDNDHEVVREVMGVRVARVDRVAMAEGGLAVASAVGSMAAQPE